MISQRQIDFRQEYRSRIIGWYDGYFHIVHHLRHGRGGVLHLHRSTSIT